MTEKKNGNVRYLAKCEAGEIVAILYMEKKSRLVHFGLSYISHYAWLNNACRHKTLTSTFIITIITRTACPHLSEKWV